MESTVIKLKIQWTNDQKTWESLDNIKKHDMSKTLVYALNKKVADMPGWTWVKSFVEADEKLHDMKSIYLASKLESKFKFGIEVAKSPKHALQLDKKENNNLWKGAIQTELDQINEYKTFRILDDQEYTPVGYKRIPYHFV